MSAPDHPGTQPPVASGGKGGAKPFTAMQQQQQPNPVTRRKPLYRRGLEQTSVTTTPAAPAGYQGQGQGHPRGSQRAQVPRTGLVLQALRALASLTPTNNRGWQVLQHLWNLEPKDFDVAVLSHLLTKPKHQQEHILLAFATTDLGKVKNLSAFLYRFMSEQDLSESVCLCYLAGCCPEGSNCKFTHPPVAAGWKVTYP